MCIFLMCGYFDTVIDSYFHPYILRLYLLLLYININNNGAGGWWDLLNWRVDLLNRRLVHAPPRPPFDTCAFVLLIL